MAKKADKQPVPFEPLGDRVLVEPLAEADQTSGGILLPDTAESHRAGKCKRGLVLAVGPGGKNDHGVFVETVVKPGQKVAYGRHAGYEIDIAGKTYLVCREVELQGVLTD